MHREWEMTPRLKSIAASYDRHQAHERLEEELRLDHFESPSWAGRHRQALMTLVAYAFLQSRASTPQDGKSVAGALLDQEAGSQTSDPRHPRTAATSGMPSL